MTAASNVLNDLRLSGESDRSTPPTMPNGVNGHDHAHAHSDDDDDPISRLQRELDKARDEKETLATQYRNLLQKLTQMRTTLGNKLKQDAVCD